MKVKLLVLLFLLPSISFAENVDWQNYIDGTIGKPLYYLYSQALTHFNLQKTYRALDIGAGAGDVDVDLLAKGWDVTAIDNAARSGEVLSERSKGLPGKLTFQKEDMYWMSLSGNYDLVTAFFSLPYSNGYYATFFNSLSSHTKKGSVLALNFFGKEHTWVKSGEAKGVTKFDIENYLSSYHFKITYFLHRIYDQKDFEGKPVHWDVFDIIAVKE